MLFWLSNCRRKMLNIQHTLQITPLRRHLCFMLQWIYIIERQLHPISSVSRKIGIITEEWRMILLGYDVLKYLKNITRNDTMPG